MKFFSRNCGASISAASLLVGFAVYFCGTRVWLSDSHDFLNYAWDIAARTYNPYYFYRAPGYPLLMVLSGATSGNLEGLFILQTLVASSIAPMMYFVLLPVSQRAATITATIAIISLIPYHFALTVYPDMFFMAGLVLLTLLVSRWMLGQGGFSTVYLIAATILALAWLRPIGLIFAVLCIPALLYRRGAMKHVAICVIAFIGINLELQHWHNKFGPPQSMFGRQVFVNFYLNGIDASLPGISELRSELIKTGGDAAKIDAALRELTLPNYWYLFEVADLRPINPKADAAFLSASTEQFAKHPNVALTYFLRHYSSFVSGSPWQYERNRTALFDLLRFGENRPPGEAVLPSKTYHPIDPEPFEKPPTNITNAANLLFSTIYPLLVPLSFWIMIVGAIVLRQTHGPERTILFTALIFHSVNIAALAALCDPRLRYHVQSIPLAMIGAGVGINAVLTALRNRAVGPEPFVLPSAADQVMP
jgi:hypothetical protein